MLKVNYVGQLYNKTYYVENHCHDFWEIVYYTQGSGTVRIGQQLIPFCENDIFAIPPRTPHHDFSDDGFCNYHYNFTDETFSFHSFLKFHDSENHAFLTILTQMYNEFHLKRYNYENLVNSLYAVLNNYIYSFIKQPVKNPYVAHMIDAIIANISNPAFTPTCEMNHIPVSPDHFRKLFLEATGKTPLQFLMSKRITYAKQLLEARKLSNLSIKEISQMAGFNDYYYFSRVFKKLTGVSPREWTNMGRS